MKFLFILFCSIISCLFVKGQIKGLQIGIAPKGTNIITYDKLNSVEKIKTLKNNEPFQVLSIDSLQTATVIFNDSSFAEITDSYNTTIQFTISASGYDTLKNKPIQSPTGYHPPKGGHNPKQPIKPDAPRLIFLSPYDITDLLKKSNVTDTEIKVKLRVAKSNL